MCGARRTASQCSRTRSRCQIVAHRRSRRSRTRRPHATGAIDSLCTSHACTRGALCSAQLAARCWSVAAPSAAIASSGAQCSAAQRCGRCAGTSAYRSVCAAIHRVSLCACAVYPSVTRAVRHPRRLDRQNMHAHATGNDRDRRSAQRRIPHGRASTPMQRRRRWQLIVMRCDVYVCACVCGLLVCDLRGRIVAGCCCRSRRRLVSAFVRSVDALRPSLPSAAFVTAGAHLQ